MKKSLIQFTMIVPLALLLCFTFNCKKQVEEAPEATTEEEVKARAERVLEIYNEGNLVLIDELYAPEFVSHDYATNEEVVGLDAFKESITSLRTQYPDFNLTFDEIIVKDDKAVFLWTTTGTNTGPLQTPMGELPPTGKKVRVSGVSISRRVNGKTAEQWVFYNMLDVMQQLGFTLTPPQPPEPPEEKK